MRFTCNTSVDFTSKVQTPMNKSFGHARGTVCRSLPDFQWKFQPHNFGSIWVQDKFIDTIFRIVLHWHHGIFTFIPKPKPLKDLAGAAPKPTQHTTRSRLRHTRQSPDTWQGGAVDQFRWDPTIYQLSRPPNPQHHSMYFCYDYI